MNQSALNGFIERFQAILDDLDDLSNENEEIEELNAQLEDCLLLMHDADPDDADGREELQDALEEIADLPDEYRDIEDVPEAVLQKADALETAVRMLMANL